jgi:hypothetical protein
MRTPGAEARKALDPEKLTQDEVWELFFPASACFFNPPAGWKPWQQPGSPKPIDLFITRLRHAPSAQSNDRGPHLRQQEELDEIGIDCPYFNARFSIFLAVGRARLWSDFAEIQRAGADEAAAAALRTERLATEIGEFLAKGGIDLTVCMPFPLYSDRVDMEDQNRRSNDVLQLRRDLEKCAASLKGHVRQSRADRGRVSIHGNSQNAWREGFAAELGYAWQNLTGKMPSLTRSKQKRDFLHFLADAFSSIGGADVSWDKAVRNMLKHVRPDWDGFDRYEKLSLPPGTEMITPEEAKARTTRWALAAERDNEESKRMIRPRRK